MTVLMTIIGVVVFFISLPTTKSFWTSFKRLLMFTCTGFIIDMCIVALAVAIGYVTF